MKRCFSVVALIFLFVSVLVSCDQTLDKKDFLTPDEREWLVSHNGKIRLAPDPSWPPVEFFDKDGSYSGIAADVVHELEKVLDFRFKIVKVGNWAEVLKLSKSRNVDVLAAATKTPERSKYMLFSAPFYENPSVMISRADVILPSELFLLKGERVIAARGYANYEYLLNNFPLLNLYGVTSVEIGLDKVSMGEADVLVADYATISYLIGKKGIANLKISGKTDHRVKLSIASRNDWPVLNSIIEKGLLKIPDEKRSEIISSWIHLNDDFFYRNRKLLVILGVSFLFFILIFFFITLWNRSLRIQVKIKTEKLKESEGKFRRIAENARDLIYRMNLVENKYEYVSPSVLDITGYTSGEFYKDPLAFEKIIHPDSKGYYREKLEDMNKGVIPSFYEYKIYKKNGDEIWLNQRNVKVCNEDGKLIALEGIVSDITERKRYEEETQTRYEELEALNEELVCSQREIEEANKLLIESERKISILLANLPGMAYRCANTPGWEMDYLSEGCYSLCGYTPDELTGNSGKTYNDIILPVDREIVWTRVQKALNESTFFEIKYRIVTKMGDVRWVWEKGRGIFNRNGELNALEGFINDVTELERKEQQLVQAQKMETIGTLAGGLAHDFNNIIGGIIGSVSLLERILSREEIKEKEKAKKYFKVMHEAADRAADLVAGLLMLAGKHDFEKEPVDLNLRVKSLINLCENSFPKSVSFVYSEPDFPVIVSGDPVQIEQVVLNLLVNASHSMTLMREEGEKQGGEILISVDRVKADFGFCYNHAEAIAGTIYWIIRISDSGVGIDEDIKKHLFDPFFSTKKKGQGSGLGLTMVESILKQHDGFIDVYSEKGFGTTVNVYFPAVERFLKNSKEKVSEDDFMGSGETLLVVDDESIMLSVAEGILEEYGYNVIVAGSGFEALQILEKSGDDVDLVILDMSMPKMSGLETFIEIRKMDPDLKVLISSGFRQDKRVDAVLEMGASGFLQKPYSAEVLSSIVRKELV